METDEIMRRMHSGEIYYENADSFKEQEKYNVLNYEYNQLAPNEHEKKRDYLERLFGEVGQDVTITQPVHANWGKNTYFGDRVYANFNLCLVDDTSIKIGSDTMIGPNVTIATASHPLNPMERRKKAQYNLPVTIGENVWLGANVTVFPGVTIGDNTVIGAGSTVTKDIPSNVLAHGTPCQVIKKIDE